MSNTAGILYQSGTAYSSRVHGFTPSVYVGSVMLVFLLVLCAVILLYLFSFFILDPLLPVSLDFSLLIVPSVFSSLTFIY